MQPQLEGIPMLSWIVGITLLVVVGVSVLLKFGGRGSHPDRVSGVHLPRTTTQKRGGSKPVLRVEQMENGQ